MDIKPALEFSDRPFLVCKDHTVSGRFFELYKDEEYDLLGTFPRPEKDKLSEYYKSENYISHTDSKESLFDKIYQVVKSYMLQKKMNWIQQEKKSSGSILDIGAGTGDFLLKAKENNWEVFGVEPNSNARNLASKKGLELREDSSEFENGKFDVITMWHVLEHVPDLEVQIKELKRLLKPDGLLVIAVPNFKSYDAKVYKENWAAYDVPRHLYHFSQSSISKIFGKFGFTLKFKKGLMFDSFYVSLLSEKYKSGKPNPVKGVFTGLISNLKASSTGEYSSLVYFLKNS